MTSVSALLRWRAGREIGWQRSRKRVWACFRAWVSAPLALRVGWSVVVSAPTLTTTTRPPPNANRALTPARKQGRSVPAGTPEPTSPPTGQRNGADTPGHLRDSAKPTSVAQPIGGFRLSVTKPRFARAASRPQSPPNPIGANRRSCSRQFWRSCPQCFYVLDTRRCHTFM